LELYSISYTDLTTNQFFELLKLRISVFVVEQNCPYQELDDLDLVSDHFFGSLEGQLIALGRVYKDLNTVYIGRVAVKSNYRKNGYARKLMEFILQEVKTKFPNLTIELSAQEYLINFYISLGFKTHGEPFLEDGIPHVKMTYFN
jgi:ElaA protein